MAEAKLGFSATINTDTVIAGSDSVISYQTLGGPENPAGLANITCASSCAHESKTGMLTCAIAVVGCLSKHVRACRRTWWRYVGVTALSPQSKNLPKIPFPTGTSTMFPGATKD